MIRQAAQLPNAVVVLAATMLFAAAGSASTVYDNSLANLNRVFHVPAVGPGARFEVGDQVFLAGADRRITSFEFECFVGIGTGSAELFGNETAELFFYANNGGESGVAPGTLLFRSGSFSLNSGFQTIMAQGLSVQVPDTFTWTVAFGGVDLGEQVGLLHYNPPLIGASFDDLWVKGSDGTWTTLLIDNGATSANFAALINAESVSGTIILAALTPTGDRTWTAAVGLAGQIAHVNLLHPNGSITVILSASMLPPGAFLNPITDFGFEDGILWIVHHQRSADGVLSKAISVFDPNNPAGTFTTVASSPVTSPVPVSDVTPATGASSGLITLSPGSIRGGPVPSKAPPAVEIHGIIAGEDPRRTPAGGASVPDDLVGLVTLPGDFRRPPPTVAPTPVTEITPGEDPRRGSATGAGFPGVIISFPTAPSTSPSPLPVTDVSPGEDPRRSALGPKQEVRKSAMSFRLRKLQR